MALVRVCTASRGLSCTCSLAPASRQCSWLPRGCSSGARARVVIDSLTPDAVPATMKAWLLQYPLLRNGDRADARGNYRKTVESSCAHYEPEGNCRKTSLGGCREIAREGLTQRSLHVLECRSVWWEMAADLLGNFYGVGTATGI